MCVTLFIPALMHLSSFPTQYIDVTLFIPSLLCLSSFLTCLFVSLLRSYQTSQKHTISILINSLVFALYDTIGTIASSYKHFTFRPNTILLISTYYSSTFTLHSWFFLFLKKWVTLAQLSELDVYKN